MVWVNYNRVIVLLILLTREREVIMGIKEVKIIDKVGRVVIRIITMVMVVISRIIVVIIIIIIIIIRTKTNNNYQ